MSLLLSETAKAQMTFAERMDAIEASRAKVYAVIETRAEYGFGHVRIRLAYIDPTQDKVFPRTFDYGVNGELEYVGICCQISEPAMSSSSDLSYGWTTGALEMGSTWHVTEAHKLERAIKALKRMTKGAEKVRAVAGHPATYGQYVGHQCSALKLAGVLVYDEGQAYRDRGWHVESAKDLVRLVDKAVTDVRKQLGFAEVAA